MKALNKAIIEMNKQIVRNQLLDEFNRAESIDEKTGIIDAMEYLQELDDQDEIAILGRLARSSAIN